MEENPKSNNEEPVEISDGESKCSGRPVEGRSKRRTHTFSPTPWLLGLVPDSILPPESKRHLWNARRETLLAGRSFVQVFARRMQSRAHVASSRARSIREMMEEEDED